MLNVGISDLIEGHPAIASYIDDAMSSQKAQSVRDRRLAESDRCGKIANAHRTIQQRDQQSHSVRLS